MSFDLLNYIELAAHPQPDELTQALRRLFMALRQAADAPAWTDAVDVYMTDARRLTGSGLLHGWNAAGALFVGEALYAGLRTKGLVGGQPILGYLIQLSMTEAQWQATRQTMQTAPANAQGGQVLRVADFPRTWLEHLFKRGEREILRGIYQGAYQAIHDATQEAMVGPVDLASWQARLGILAACLTLRRWLPLQPGHAMLTWLFNAEEIDRIQQQEAQAEALFGHLFAAHFGGMITAEHQQEVAQQYAQRLAEDPVQAAQWRQDGQSRFEVAPYH
ncbi:MAG TPA: hypothetical protein VFW93_14375 [Aquabacterium sp.]|uniref:hypothetical protein n=1 Tax=Aquabacterium sp. TaxID=1872578 RepID=UPI002E335B27|nr:hypothetical protein [Aquabacterium sp.]HEX5357396.1 hypothetical protein [Aquabacterium sp.]